MASNCHAGDPVPVEEEPGQSARPKLAASVGEFRRPKFVMTTAAREAGLETALLYHEETKHHLHRYARSLGYLAWEDQPNPFREFQGASHTGQASRTDQRVELPLAREEDPLPFVELFSSQPAAARELSLRTLGRLFELSLALSAWKEIPGHRWALRINPSSGNLHPTEAYALLPAMERLGSRGG